MACQFERPRRAIRDFALSPPCLRDNHMHSIIRPAAGVQRLLPL